MNVSEIQLQNELAGHSLGGGLAILASAAVSTYPPFPVIAFGYALLSFSCTHLPMKNSRTILSVTLIWWGGLFDISVQQELRLHLKFENCISTKSTWRGSSPLQISKYCSTSFWLHRLLTSFYQVMWCMKSTEMGRHGLGNRWDEIMRTTWDEQLGRVCLYEAEMAADCKKCFDSPTCVLDSVRTTSRRSMTETVSDADDCMLCFFKTHYLANLIETVQKGEKPACELLP